MSRVAQPAGMRGSLKWIQRAVNDRPDALDAPLLAQLDGASRIEWRSPLAADDYAEYRDGDFLDRVLAGDLRADLAAFWPERGPQWDALARSDRGDILLVEAKAHVAEMLSPATQAGPACRVAISDALERVAADLAAEPKAAWTTSFYQLANRLAHLWLMRRAGKPAWLVLANFLGDTEMNGPESAREWEAAYLVAFHIMGLPKRHALSRYILHVYPRVEGMC